MISDVPGDDPAIIASGPTVPDPTTFADARAILAKYGIAPPPAVAAHLASAQDETPKPGDPRLARAETHLIATPQASLTRAAAIAGAAGIAPLFSAIPSKANRARLRASWRASRDRFAATVSLALRPASCCPAERRPLRFAAKGAAGRNVEFLLALALALRGQAQTWAIAGDTDGVDGAEEIAGAIIAPDTLERAAAPGHFASPTVSRTMTPIPSSRRSAIRSSPARR